jgi:hypothetical protein
MPEIVFDPPSIDAPLGAQLLKIKARIDNAIAAATQRLADNILQEGRQDIASAGKFGTRWTEGLTADIANGNLTIRQAVPYWSVFQTGAVIQGKPLLWIPLSFADVPPGTYARDFPGRLFRVDRKAGGAPLLMSADDKQPKYHGQTSVRIGKKFHLVEIVNAQTKTFGALYRAELAKG